MESRTSLSDLPVGIMNLDLRKLWIDIENTVQFWISSVRIQHTTYIIEKIFNVTTSSKILGKVETGLFWAFNIMSWACNFVIGLVILCSTALTFAALRVRSTTPQDFTYKVYSTSHSQVRSPHCVIKPSAKNEPWSTFHTSTKYCLCCFFFLQTTHAHKNLVGSSSFSPSPSLSPRALFRATP